MGAKYGNVRRRLPLMVILLAVVVPSSAFAQEPDQLIDSADAASGALAKNSVGGDLLFGKIGGCTDRMPDPGDPPRPGCDFFLTLNLRLNFDTDNWGLGVALPLRIRLTDKNGRRADDIGGFLRKRDWDEFSDFLKVLRYVYVGQRDKKGPYYVRVGELSGLSMGHGTIVHRYSNGLDIDKFRIGTNAAVNIGAFGGEVAIGDVSRIDQPILAGYRFTVRPLELALGDGLIWDRLVVGHSLITDPTAPYELQRNGSQLAQDDDGAFIATRERALAIVGFDLGIEVLQGPLLKIEPYIDLNKMNIVDRGWGLHMGVLWGINVPVLIDDLVLDLRTEYRRVSSDYIGPYFNAFYELERFSVLSSNGVPKVRLLKDSSGSGRNGVFFELLAGLPKWAFIGGEFVDYDGGEDDGTLLLSAHVPALEFVQFSAYYYRSNISGTDDLFKLKDDKSQLVAEVKVPLYTVFVISARWWRVWEATPDGYQSVDDWSIGAGVSFEL